MSFEQSIHRDWTQNDINSEDSSLNNWTLSSAAVTSSSDNLSTAFECNICLDSVQDPVVTFCGHLFCWPCIYRWLHQKRIADNEQEDHSQECPVCKAEISESALIPLYGRGQTAKPLTDEASGIDIVIPSRPVGPAIEMLRYNNGLAYPNSSQHLYYSHPAQSRLHHPYLSNYDVSQTFSPTGSETRRNEHSPLISVLGDMVNAMMFGNSDTNLYTSPSYHLENTASLRVRRHIMQADESLGRISFFLFCCAILCLLSF